GVAYANPAERAQQARLDSARALIEQNGPALANEVDVADVNERLRRVQGALVWQLAQEQPERRWNAEKGLRSADATLAAARTHDAALAAIQRDEPGRFDAYGARIKELAARINALQPRIAALTTEQQKVLQDSAVVALREQQQRLVGYTNQARYAVAQLY